MIPRTVKMNYPISLGDTPTPAEKGKFWMSAAQHILTTGAQHLEITGLRKGIGQRVNYIECLTHALNEDPDNLKTYLALSYFEGWSSLKLSSPSGKVQLITTASCYKKALQLGLGKIPNEAAIYLLTKLANPMSPDERVSFGEREWTRAECFLKVLELLQPDTDNQRISEVLENIATSLPPEKRVVMGGNLSMLRDVI